MKLSMFKNLLRTHSEKNFRLVLPDQTAIPISFHITEVAYVQKKFIDCGGKLHSTETCQLQAWEGDDADHRLLSGKMADVLDLARAVLPEGKDLDVEVEYENAAISQYSMADYTVTENAVLLKLANKHTDCLAKDICCPSPVKLPMALIQEAACCSDTSSNCCR